MAISAARNLRGTTPDSLKCSADVLANRAVKYGTRDATSGEFTVVPCTAITDICIGSSMNSGESADGDRISIQTGGIALLVASDAVSAGAEVMVTAAGAGKVVTAAGATARSIGVALTASLADGEVIAVLLNVPNVKGMANA